MAPGRTDGGKELTPFELERLKRIEQNKERMKSLNLPSLSDVVQPVKRKTPAASQRGLPKKRTVTPMAERRRSSRIRGDAADGNEVTEELRGGKVLTSSMAPPEPEGPVERHSKVDIPFDSNNATDEEDAHMMSFLKRSANASPGRKSPGKKAPGKTKKIASLSLDEKHVAKVTKAGTTHLSFMPGSELVVAAGDKKGGVGLWRVDAEEKEDSCDGVHVFAPHSQYVSGLVWGARSSSLGGRWLW